MARQAKQGFVGYVRLVPSAGSPSGGIPVSGISVRVTSADLKLAQAIDFPDVVDNKVDRTLYQLKPQTVTGGISFPLVHEGSGLTGNVAGKSGDACGFNIDSLVSRLWRLAAQRDNKGRMMNIFDAQVRYADNLAYTYSGCLVNTLTITIKEQAEVTCSADIIGGANANGTPLAKLRNDGVIGASELTAMLSPARVITWNDALVNIKDDNGADLLLGEEIREFSCVLANQIEAYYTLNTKLLPQDISAKKRQINGNLTIMGHNETLSNYTETNENRFSSSATISFGYKLGANQVAYWATDLWGVVFEIEEVGLQTGLFETKTKWTALGDCTHNYEATHLGDAGKTSTIEGYPAFGANS